MLSKKSELIRSFLKGYNQEVRFDMYDLVLSELEEKFLFKRLKECVLTFERCPTVAEIMGTNTKDTGDVETAWQEFKKTCCNNLRFDPMPDWVFTIKKLIGEIDVEEMTHDTEKWVKKEFLRIFPAIKAGTIELKQENAKYELVGGSNILIGNSDNKVLTDLISLQAIIKES